MKKPFPRSVESRNILFVNDLLSGGGGSFIFRKLSWTLVVARQLLSAFGPRNQVVSASLLFEVVSLPPMGRSWPG